MTELVEWLRAQVELDKKIILAHPVPGPWSQMADRRNGQYQVEGPERWLVVREDDGGMTEAETTYFATFDPNRLLAECELKEKILRDAAEVPTISMRHVLRLMATVYADREGYRHPEDFLRVYRRAGREGVTP